MEEFSVVGKSKRRIDGAGRVTGGGKFIGDIRFPQMLEGKILRSTYAHAKILNIDVSKAKKLPGVKAVVTAADLPDRRFHWVLSDQTVFARGKVRYMGQPVAAVAAIDEWTAEQALDMIEVEYEELPAVFDPEEALKPDAPIIHEDLAKYRTLREGVIRYGNVAAHVKGKRGDIEKGFQQSDDIFEDRYTTQSQYHAYTEPRAGIASVEADGKVTIWINTQSVFAERMDVAEVLGLPLSKVRIIAPLIGGSYGGKGYVFLGPHCAILAIKTRRPVRIIYDQEEDMIDSRSRLPCIIHIKTGVKKDGRIIARQFKMIYNTGAFAHEGPGIAKVGLVYGPGPYKIPNLKLDSLCVYTNNLIFGPFRGYGAVQTTFGSESQIDTIAEKLGIDRVEIRMKNGVEEGDTHPVYGFPMYGVGLKKTIQLASEKLGMTKKEKTRQNRGKGIACLCYTSGGMPSSAFGRLNEDGTLAIFTSQVDIGQGSNTALSQIAAEELGLDLEDITISVPDSDTTPFHIFTGADNVTRDAGNAILAAVKDIKNQILGFAAEKFEINAEDLEIKNKKVYVKGSPQKFITLAEVSMTRHYFTDGPIIGRGSVFLKLPPPTGDTTCELIGDPHHPYFPTTTFATQSVEVEVDTETGHVEMLNVAAAHDVGRVINPMNVEGQIEGAFSQGLGMGLMEDLIIEEGKVLNPDFMNYKILTSMDMPKVFPMVAENLDPGGPFEAKGIGESALIPTPAALANAIYDAVGVRIKDLPITPEKVLKALKEKEERRD